MVKDKVKITLEKVREIADLANIYLSDDEVKKYQKEIESILEYVAKIDEVDTGKIEFKSQTDLKNVFKSDMPKASLTQEQAISNRKKVSKNGYFVISKVISK